MRWILAVLIIICWLASSGCATMVSNVRQTMWVSKSEPVETNRYYIEVTGTGYSQRKVIERWRALAEDRCDTWVRQYDLETASIYHMARGNYFVKHQVAFGVAVCTSPPDPSPTCTTDMQCSVNKTCVDRQCVFPLDFGKQNVEFR